MRSKLYLVAPVAAQQAIASACLAAQREWHTHSLPPAHATMLVVVVSPPLALELDLCARYLAFPELHDPSEHVPRAVLDAFPADIGLTPADSTFAALKKIYAGLGFAAMHPKS